MCRRAVRVKSQLKSHKRFAEAFMTYCQLVDNARLYCTNALEGPPKVHISLPSSLLFFNFPCQKPAACAASFLGGKTKNFGTLTKLNPLYNLTKQSGKKFFSSDISPPLENINP